MQGGECDIQKKQQKLRLNFAIWQPSDFSYLAAEDAPSSLRSKVVGESRAVFDADEEDVRRNEEREVRSEHVKDALAVNVTRDVILRLLLGMARECEMTSRG